MKKHKSIDFDFSFSLNSIGITKQKKFELNNLIRKPFSSNYFHPLV